MAYLWHDDPTETLVLSNNNSIQVAPIDLMGLVMSSDNKDIPNGLLEQISAQLSGQAPDQELTCNSGLRLPVRGEPVSQSTVRGSVVDVTGTEEQFTVRVAIPSGLPIKPGEIRFGGISVAMVESVREWSWRIGGGDADKARRDLPELGGFIDLIVRAASVLPKVVKEVTDPETELDIKRLKQADKMVIFNWAMPHEVRPAGMFPQEPAAGVVITSDLQGISPEPGSGVRDNPPVGEVAV